MPQILVVDDEEPIREVLIEFLSAHGYSAVGVDSGARALQLARSMRPLVILLDIAMPGMNGIETLKRLRQDGDAPAVIMISGHADNELACRALEMGAFDFIEKPLDFQYLERTLLTRLVTLDREEAADSGEEDQNGETTGARG